MNYDCLKNSNIELKSHQLKPVKYFFESRHNSLLLVHPTGMGKTLTAIAISKCFLQNFKNTKVIFVGPSSLLTNFKKELKKYGITDLSDYELYSYQKFLNEEDNINCSGNLLIVDEVHNLRTMSLRSKSKGKRAMSVFVCSRYARKRLLLTATPYVNSLDDFFPIINFLYGRTEIKSKIDLMFPEDLIPYLRNKIDYIDIPPELKKYFPKVKEYMVEETMEPEYEKKYCKLIQGERIDDDVFRNPSSFYNGHRRAINKIGNGKEYFSQKMKIILKLLGDKKTLIFSNWLDYGLVPIQKILNQKHISNKTFSGLNSQKEKKNIIEEFNDDKFQVLIISKSGSEGLDLKGVRNVFVMDPVWNFSGLEQIKGRAIRFNSHEHLPKEERTVDVYYLSLNTTTPGCISGDRIVYNIVNNKKKFQESITYILKNISI